MQLMRLFYVHEWHGEMYLRICYEHADRSRTTSTSTAINYEHADGTGTTSTEALGLQNSHMCRNVGARS